MRPGFGEHHTFPHQCPEIDDRLVELTFSISGLTRAQDLFNRAEEAVGIIENYLVELLSLLFADFPSLECLQEESDRRDGRLQLMRDGVDEAIVLLVPSDLTNNEDGIEDKAGDDQAEENDTEDKQRDLTPVEKDPADVQRNGDGDEKCAEDYEKSYRFALTTCPHDGLL